MERYSHQTSTPSSRHVIRLPPRTPHTPWTPWTPWTPKKSVAVGSLPLIAAVPGDRLLDLTGFSSYPTRWVRKSDGNPQSLLGIWKTPLLTFVTGSHIVFVYAPGTLEFSSDRTYFLHLTRIQTGTLKATNGVYTLTSGLLSAQGNYRFEGSDQFVDTQSGTTAVWKRH